MSIPDYQTLMLPTLQFFSDGQEHSKHELVDALAKEFQVSAEERRKMLPSGRLQVLDNRANWARTCLKKAGLLEQTRRGYNRITKRGQEVLKQKPPPVSTCIS